MSEEVRFKLSRGAERTPGIVGLVVPKPSETRGNSASGTPSSRERFGLREMGSSSRGKKINYLEGTQVAKVVNLIF